MYRQRYKSKYAKKDSEIFKIIDIFNYYCYSNIMYCKRSIHLL